jgi:hypothetical protein
MAVCKRSRACLPLSLVIDSRLTFKTRLWRPLRGPVEDWPLAVCDYRTVDQATDSVLVDQVYPHSLAEGINYFHNARHQWYYASSMSAEEAWLIKIIDTDAAQSGLAGSE